MSWDFKHLWFGNPPRSVSFVDGNRFIDWTSGVLATNVGHCHPYLVKKVQEATAQLLNNCECANVHRIEAAKRLVEALPRHLDRCFFLSTGTGPVSAVAATSDSSTVYDYAK